MQILVCYGFNPCFGFFGVDRFRNCRLRIYAENLIAVLVAVECRRHERSLVRSILNVRNIIWLTAGESDGLCLACLDIVAVERHFRIRFSGYRVFVAHRAGIQTVLLHRRACALIEGKIVERNSALVETDVCECEIVGCPCHKRCRAEFLLVCPVSSAVDYRTVFAVSSHGNFCLIVEFCRIDVVVGNESHHA